jgi:hypothetical protein
VGEGGGGGVLLVAANAWGCLCTLSWSVLPAALLLLLSSLK